MKKYCLVILIGFLATPYQKAFAQKVIFEESVNFLALGDSYTIGDGVVLSQRWPNQLADTLRSLGIEVNKIDNISRTGWTTSDLLFELEQNPVTSDYNLVSLLIGVNNQFQGLSIEDYTSEFEQLLDMALSFAGRDKSRVFVLSIPDYGITPWGIDTGSLTISEEIDAFNEVNKEITSNFNIAYINVTDISRLASDKPELLAADKLHPSGLMYKKWVKRLMGEIEIKKNDPPPPPLVTSTHDLSNDENNPIVINEHLLELSSISDVQYIDIIDLYGRQIISKSKPENIIDLTYLSPGFYILRWVDQKGGLKAEKFYKEL